MELYEAIATVCATLAVGMLLMYIGILGTQLNRLSWEIEKIQEIIKELKERLYK